MNWKEANWCVIDIETTGLSPDYSGILEISIVTMRHGEVVEAVTTYINPGHPVPKAAFDVNGISDECVKDAPSIEDVADLVNACAAEATVLVAYNAPFDFGFLATLCPGFAEAASDVPILDPLVAVRLESVGKYWKGAGRHRLASVCDRLGLLPDGAYHSAYFDAVMAGKVLWTLRDELPDDLAEACAMLAEAREAQDEEHKSYRRSRA